MAWGGVAVVKRTLAPIRTFDAVTEGVERIYPERSNFGRRGRKVASKIRVKLQSAARAVFFSGVRKLLTLENIFKGCGSNGTIRSGRAQVILNPLTHICHTSRIASPPSGIMALRP